MPTICIDYVACRFVPLGNQRLRSSKRAEAVERRPRDPKGATDQLELLVADAGKRPLSRSRAFI